MSSDAIEVRDAAPRYRADADHQDAPTGFKQTEIGVIPEHWDVSTVGGEFTVQLGKMLDAAKNVGEPKLYLGNRSVQWGRIDLEGLATVRMSPSDIQRFRLREGDLLVCEGGEIGRAAIWDGAIPECYYQKALHRLRQTHGYDAYLMQSLFQLWAATGYLSNYVTQTSIAHLPKDKLKIIPLPRPSATEQRAIAEALSDVDGLLGALEALIAKKRAIKQAAMQQLLTGKIRLPGFSGEWETKRLGEVADIESGATPSTQVPANWDGDIPWCTPTDITGTPGKYLVSTERRITRQGLASCAAKLLPRGALLLCSRATVGELKIATTAICTNQGFKSLVCKWGTSNEFLYYLLLTLKPALIERSSGSTFLEIGKRDVASLQGLFPPEEEQNAIATVLSDMDAEIAALESRRDKTRSIKQGMMQQLLTGRIRLVKPRVGARDTVTEQAGRRKTNVHFVRSVLAAEIIDRLHEHPTFGHVKFEKMMFLVEHLCEIETGSTYLRKAAGPYDNRALRSIDSQIRKQQWFDARKVGERYRYVPMPNRGGHKKYFDRYFPGIGEAFDTILEAFEALDTKQCEIVATLLAAWTDLLRNGAAVSDALIVHEVLTNWHESKQQIPEERWLKALDWMKGQGFVPKGTS
jgi:type I restriction enzyme S subunit